MSAELDLDDVAATSPLAQRELADLRELIADLRSALDRITRFTPIDSDAHNIARQALAEGK